MDPKQKIMGLFTDEDQTISALHALESSPWSVEGVHSPFPSHRVQDALKLKKSKVGYFTLAGGILGFLIGIGLAAHTAVQWNLVVSGKPVVALVPFFIVGFEFSVLFAIFGNVLGLLTQARLPRFKELAHHDPRCTGGHFGILVSYDKGQESKILEFFKEKGGEVKTFE
jgi:molybdopterin-containing oxidoreductase family membrane subunit